ncbi:hypothetical protein [Odoribacter sp. Z80]|uniref:hypothetical protein n=1 Tax=Odoribacter sp. Z80 TaxID=2304575 RepID=UPI001F17E2ED|nr:hypothetical protein [Odoribacter sp. Z80]
MERGIITISETGTVVVPDVPVWMTLPEIADMFGVFEYDVRKVIKSIYRNRELYGFETMKYVKQADGISYDVYSLEMVMAVSFRIQSKKSRMCRQFLMKRACSGKDNTITPPVYFLIYKDDSNRQGRDKGNWYN